MKKCFKLLICFAVTLLCFVFVASSATVSAASEENNKWISAWGTAPAKLNIKGMSAVGSLVGDVTVRVVITPTASGESFRIKLSNIYGSEPLKIKNITAARSKGNSKIDINTLKYVTFHNGSPDVTVAAGEEIYSDPVVFPVNAFEPIAISMFIGEYQDVTTMGLSGATTYFTTGEATRTENYDLLLNVFDEQDMLDTVSKLLVGLGGTGSIDFKLSYSFMKFVPAIASLDVLTDASGYSIVVAGDSTVADGFPEYLARTVCQQNNIENVGVSGKGLIGNRLLASGLGLGAEIDGASLLARFERDVLGESGVEYVIIKIGANDIIYPVCASVLQQYPGTKQHSVFR